jgi:hypothetical protein
MDICLVVRRYKDWCENGQGGEGGWSLEVVLEVMMRCWDVDVLELGYV